MSNKAPEIRAEINEKTISIHVSVLKNYCPTIYRIVLRELINSFFVCSNELVMLNKC